MTSSIFCHFNKFVATSMLYLWDSKGNLLRLHVGTVRITFADIGTPNKFLYQPDCCKFRCKGRDCYFG
jgi:hypothetical protein